MIVYKLQYNFAWKYYVPTATYIFSFFRRHWSVSEDGDKVWHRRPGSVEDA